VARSDSAWRAFGRSVRGEAHVRQNLPNQDAIAIQNGLPGGGTAMAVADGHGNAIHFRSETGAMLAVAAAIDVLSDVGAVFDLSDLPDRIVERWRKSVEEHLAEHPYAPGESPVGPFVPYGTTLLAALARRDWVLYFQIGDGDVLAVDDAGCAARPLPPDPRLTGVRTTSLCQNDAAHHARVRRVEESPALIILSTDGYANSYANDEAFLQIGPDYLALVRENADDVERRLEDILTQVTRQGSGDDITLGLLVRDGGSVRVVEEPKRRSTRRLWILTGVLLILAGLIAKAVEWLEPIPPPKPHIYSPKAPPLKRPAKR